MERQKFPTRTIQLRGHVQVQTLLSLAPNLPLDEKHPLEVVIREKEKPRKLDQNALMWSGPLADIEEQGYIEGRCYSADVWHHHFKTLYLPEEAEDGITKEGYRKWEYSPCGERVLVGSTGDLTVKGFALYLEQVIAFGANLGVQFHASPRERIAA